MILCLYIMYAVGKYKQCAILLQYDSKFEFHILNLSGNEVSRVLIELSLVMSFHDMLCLLDSNYWASNKTYHIYASKQLLFSFQCVEFNVICILIEAKKIKIPLNYDLWIIMVIRIDVTLQTDLMISARCWNDKSINGMVDYIK